MPDATRVNLGRTLLARCGEGDDAAWREMVGRYGGYAMALARASGLPEDACEDVTQSAFAALAASVDRLEDDAVIPAWLRTTVGRLAQRWRASARRSGPLAVEPASSENVAASMERIEEHRRLREALAALGVKCRELLAALAAAPKVEAYRVVSKQLGVPVGSIGPTRRRCLARLAALFGEDEDANRSER